MAIYGRALGHWISDMEGTIEDKSVIANNPKNTTQSSENSTNKPMNALQIRAAFADVVVTPSPKDYYEAEMWINAFRHKSTIASLLGEKKSTELGDGDLNMSVWIQELKKDIVDGRTEWL